VTEKKKKGGKGKKPSEKGILLQREKKKKKKFEKRHRVLTLKKKRGVPAGSKRRKKVGTGLWSREKKGETGQTQGAGNTSFVQKRSCRKGGKRGHRKGLAPPKDVVAKKRPRRQLRKRKGVILSKEKGGKPERLLL